MLDASKAFDRVEYVRLFSLLTQKGLCPLVCRLLAYMYTNQSIRIKWGKCMSKFISVSNGVKRGGFYPLYCSQSIWMKCFKD